MRNIAEWKFPFGTFLRLTQSLALLEQHMHCMSGFFACVGLQCLVYYSTSGAPIIFAAHRVLFMFDIKC